MEGKAFQIEGTASRRESMRRTGREGQAVTWERDECEIPRPNAHIR